MFKKVLAIFMTAVIAMGALSITAFAADDNVLKSGKAVSGRYHSCEYTFNVKSSGTLEISFTSTAGNPTITVSKDGVEDIKIQSVKLSDGCSIADGGKGKTFLKGQESRSTSKFTATLTYKVSNGTYVIYVVNNNDYTENVTLKATFKSNSNEINGKPEYFTIDMKKGSALQLGAVVTEKGGKYEYSSSKTSVATVSGTGKVTAKSKGSAIITLKYGKGSIKIKINVI